MRAVLGAAVAAGITLAALALGETGVAALVAAVSVVATGELLRLGRAAGVRPSAPVALGGTLALVVVSALRGEDAPPLFPGVLAAALGAAYVAALLRRDRAGLVRGLAFTVVPVAVVGVLGAFVVALHGARDGARLVLVLAMMAFAAEAATDAARARREPGMPIALALAAAAALIVAAVAAIVATETFPWGAVLPLGALVGAATVAGVSVTGMIEDDLVPAGARGAGARMLRRIDGILLAAPVFFYAFRLIAR